MKKIKIIFTACILTISMLMCVGCNNSDSSSNTTESSNVSTSNNASSDFKPTETSVAYKVYRLIVNDSLIEKPLDKQFNDNNGFIPDELYKTSVEIKAYANKNGEMVIAENTTDKLNGLNEIVEHNDDFTSCTIDNNVKLVVKTAVNDNNELYVVMDKNVAAYEVEQDNRNGSTEN